MRHRKWLIIPLVIIMLLALTYGSIEYTSRPKFCATCHEMRGNYQSWQKGPHQSVNCLLCHVDPGAKALVKRKIQALGEVTSHITGNYKKPIHANVHFQNCLRCHTGFYQSEYPQAKNITQVTGPKAPAFTHADVIKNKTSCLQCHTGVAHGTPARME